MKGGKTVAVIGLGYVGAVTAACLAYGGIEVRCFDIDRSRLEKVKSGEPPVYEPRLGEVMREASEKGTLMASGSIEEAVQESSFSFITVGTPSREDGSVELGYVVSATRGIGSALRRMDDHHVVVVKSTVPPGTTRGTILPELERSSGRVCGVDFGLCANPEFLREGSAVEDALRPDRIVIGYVDRESGERLLALYREFYGPGLPSIIMTDSVNAELIKYASNAFLAMKVSFINMVARLCEHLPGGDVDVVARGMGLDKRIAPYFLNASMGWGGSCFPKDLRALRGVFTEHGITPHLIDATIRANEEQVKHVADMLDSELGGVKGKRIAILGLSFKEGTDDVRESQAIKLVELLLSRGASVSVYDPQAMENAGKILGGRVKYSDSWRSCVKDSDAVVIATPWDEFREIDTETLSQLAKNRLVVDTRRILRGVVEGEGGIKLRMVGVGGARDAGGGDPENDPLPPNSP